MHFLYVLQKAHILLTLGINFSHDILQRVYATYISFDLLR